MDKRFTSNSCAETDKYGFLDSATNDLLQQTLTVLCKTIESETNAA